MRREGRERGKIRRGRKATQDLYFLPKCCLRFAYLVVINSTTEETYKCVHCVKHDRNSCGDEMCNSRSVLVNIPYHIWKPSLRPQKINRFNNNFARASRFFVHFFTVTARLRHESALLWRAKTQYSDFLSLFLNCDAVLRRTEREEIIKFEGAQIYFKAMFFTYRHRCLSKFDRSAIFPSRSNSR